MIDRELRANLAELSHGDLTPEQRDAIEIGIQERLRVLEARLVAYERGQQKVEDEVRLAQSNLGLAYDDLSPRMRQRIFNARGHLSAALKALSALDTEGAKDA